MNNTNNIENLVVTRDGHIDDEYYDAIYAAKRREALHTAGKEALRAMTLPIRNFSLNMIDLIKYGTLNTQ